MTALTLAEITQIFSLVKQSLTRFKTFVETGTWRGHTIFGMEQYFDHLFTIEIKEDLYLAAKNQYYGDKIQFLLGDSADKISDVLDELSTPVIFWLDGHWSMGDTGRGAKDCPLVEELQHINNKCSQEAVIIIDDYRLFGHGIGHRNDNDIDWTDINTGNLVQQLKDKNINSVIQVGDRLVIHIQ
jgi:hypothetical protein